MKLILGVIQLSCGLSIPTLPPSLFPSSPEVGLGELLHVELLVCEGGQVDVTNSWEHFT